MWLNPRSAVLCRPRESEAIGGSSEMSSCAPRRDIFASMARRWMIGPGVAAAVLLAACGGSHTAATSSSTSAPASTAPVASPPPAGIRGRLLTDNELPSFRSAGVTVATSLQRWLAAGQPPPAQAAAEKAMLGSNGFREGAREDLANGGTAGLSIVEQFRSPEAARAALAYYVALSKTGASGTFQAFSVHGIPGAEGLGDSNNSGVNIAFTDGPYYYLVGQMGGGPATIAGLNAAVLHLYHRVHR
jgi:hypothetical protein